MDWKRIRMKPKLRVLIIGIVAALIISACEPTETVTNQALTISDENSEVEYIEIIGVQEEIKYTSDGTPYIVNPDKIKSGGPPMDGIPSIDDPKFMDQKDVDFLNDEELVLTLTYKNEKRVYPLQIMVWHEIVNDVIAGDPILITYCPLCGTGIAYDRNIEGTAVEFGTSGKLYNSNLVMYDRKTETYWSQIGGKAIIGELTGMRLKALSVDTIPWGEWKKTHSDAKVLTKNTGHIRLYGVDPYGDYYTNPSLYFAVEEESDAMHPKSVIYGVEIDGRFKAYREEDVLIQETFTDSFANETLTFVIDNAGVINIEDQSGNEIVKERGFWFSWYAFHPTTEVYEPEE